MLVLPASAPKIQLVEMRKAYFTGSGEPSAEDLRRVELIHQELRGFEAELRAEIAARAQR